MDDAGPKRYGRGLFLATLFGGLTSIAWGRPVWNRVSAGLTGVEALVPLSFAVALLGFGYLKGRFTGMKPLRSAYQTTLIGGLAAAAAFAVARLIA